LKKLEANTTDLESLEEFKSIVMPILTKAISNRDTEEVMHHQFFQTL